MADIYHLITIKANAEMVYNAVTTQEGLSNWWLPDTVAKPMIGFVNEFRVGTQFVNKMKNVVLEQNKKVEWECLNEADEWTGTHIIFELTEKESLCFLHFRHTGWKAQTEMFGNCSFHWARHLIMLKHLCETGISILDNDGERQLADSALKHL